MKKQKGKTWTPLGAALLIPPCVWIKELEASREEPGVCEGTAIGCQK